ncbi:cytosol aminopeptidase [Vairimorpha necatrix]|uniref:Cytosol aminopeptidase n=1 Tax=Vairimorpha necatrix TaxID=6039 RepID=A0AAX4JEF8_9MICR
MSLLNYEQLFVKTVPIESAIKVNIIPYSYKNKEYSTSDSSNLDYLKNLNPASNSTYRIMPDKSIECFVCLSRNDEEADEWRASVATSGASCYNLLSHFDNPLNINIKNIDNIRDFISGIVLAYYKYNFLFKKSSDRQAISIISEYDEFVEISNAQNFVRFLGDTPANLMTPSIFTKYVEKYCQGMDFTVYDKDFMSEKNMNLLLGVSRGSNEDPKLIKISYKGSNKDNIDVSLVGKGITFDTGGISLKSPANMSAMKGDMLGAATVLATIKLAHDKKLKINIEAILPLSENMPGGRATKPGDVHVSMSGLSVEVDNTDAEGRLILGDALTFAQESSPEYLFDIATLTGAMTVALGEDYLGYFCNNEDLNEIINKSSDESGDLAWRMPLSNLFLSCMKSNVADLKNAGNRKGGSCSAAIFLSKFVKENVKWCHFDIAGVDFDHRNKVLYGKGMTGRGFPLLYELVKNLSDQ